MSVNRDSDDLIYDAYDRFLEARFRGAEPDPLSVDGREDLPEELQRELDEAARLADEVVGERVGTPPPRIAGYEIVEELGRGGMGTVYLAWQESLQRNVAVKVLPHSVAISRRGRRRFLEEARALAGLHHDHIVAVHDVIEQGDLLAYSMEWIEGASLSQLLARLAPARRREGGLCTEDLAEALGGTVEELGCGGPLQFWLRTGIDIAHALHEVHGAALVHRDVKPGNVMFRRNGQALLTDFGLVRSSVSSRTMTGVFVGTPIYAPPEQLMAGGGEADRTDSDSRSTSAPPVVDASGVGLADGAPVDHRADIYALGVTLYEAIAGTPPFHGATTPALVRRIQTGGAARLRSVAPGTPRDLEIVLEKAMDPDPDRRYSTAVELADDLHRVLDRAPIQARRAGVSTRAWRAAVRNRRGLVAAAIGGAVVLAAFGTVLYGQDQARWRTGRLDALVREAHGLLARSDVRRATWLHRQRGLASDVEFEAAQQKRREALDRYELALALEPLRPLQVERDALRLTLRLPEVAASGLTVETAKAEFPALGELTPSLISAVTHVPPYWRSSTGAVASRQREAMPVLRPGGHELGEALYARGLLGFLAGNSLTCERHWRLLDQEAENGPLVGVALGQIYLDDGRVALALSQLRKAVRALPLPGLRLDVAAAALELGDVRTASVELEQVKPRVAGERRYRLLCAWVAESKDPERARDEYLELIREHPADPDPRYRLVMLEWGAGRVAEARALLEKLVEDHPGVARYRLALARAALREDDLELYLAQARFVVGSQFGRGRSEGEVTAFLDILQLGGLHRVYEAGMRRTGGKGSADVVGLSEAAWDRSGRGPLRTVEDRLLRQARRGR